MLCVARCDASTVVVMFVALLLSGQAGKQTNKQKLSGRAGLL